MPGISVIIPNYNRETLIGETITNLLVQSRPPDEIIVVDDGSTDNSIEVISSFGSRIRLIQQSNQGPGAARNAGLQMAIGDFIQFQDSDDLLSLNKLEAQANLLDKTGADIAFGPWAPVLIENKKVTIDNCIVQQDMPASKISLQFWMLRWWTTIFQSLLFRRSFLGHERYLTDLKLGEDMELLFRLLCRSPRTCFAEDALTLYRKDAPKKLSQDAGLAKSQREVDWAKCLHGMIGECRARDLKPDLITRLIFLTGIRNHLRNFRDVSGLPAELISILRQETHRMPIVGLAMFDFWLRILGRARLVRTGYRWMPGLQVAPATSRQIQLIQALGFEVDQPALKRV